MASVSNCRRRSERGETTMFQMYVEPVLLRAHLHYTHTHTLALHAQVSALELDIIEVDPETKEMLKTLV